MRLFASLYCKVLVWSKHKYASLWLAMVSFAESSFFPVPPDIMLISMTLVDRTKAVKFALLATIFSVIGGLFGYWIGMMFIDFIYPLLVQMGYEQNFLLSKHLFAQYGFWIIVLVGFTPIPYKVFTICAGCINMNILYFVLGSLIGRGLRYFMVTAIIYWHGDKLHGLMLRYFDMLGWILVLLSVNIFYKILVNYC